MVGLRRFGPLLAVVVLAWIVLLARAFQVQVLEHDFWAREAVNLGRSWTVEPYKRGSIVDRKHRPIVRDEESYELEFVWRDFRRGHPLGQVSEALSVSTLRHVSLVEACAHLAQWAEELVSLSPAEIDAFGRGGALVRPSLDVPACSDPGAEQRAARRSHLHFYVRALLAVDAPAARVLRAKRQTAEWSKPYLQLVAEARGLAPERLLEELRGRVGASLADLERLAAHFAEGTAARAATPFEAFLARIDGARREVEDVAADDLFEAATGFEAWRLSAANLARIDLEWLRQSLFWSQERLERWIDSRGAEFEHLLEGELAPLVLARCKRGAPAPEERLLDGMAWLFRSEQAERGVLAAAPSAWRELDELAVLDQVEDLFADVDLPEAVRLGLVLPFQEEGLRRATDEGLALVERACSGSGGAGDFDLFAIHEKYGVTRAAVYLYEAARDSERATWRAEEAHAAAAVLRSWNERLQASVAKAFDLAQAEQQRKGRLRDGRLLLREGRRKVALEERDYVVRDRGARPLRLMQEPGYDLVRLVARFPERFAGFSARTVSRRVPLTVAPGGEAPPLAEALVGKVQLPTLLAFVRQEEERRELLDLTGRIERSEEEDQLLRELVAKSLRASEWLGSTGIEGYFDPLLAGRNGFRETQGLEERERAGRAAFYQPPVDGLDLVLTLDLDLQRAAQDVLEHPARPPAGEDYDPEWLAHPVGAIVLLSAEGDVLAAASAPDEPGQPGLHQDGQRAVVIERSLRMPLHEPPGSVLKPFWAAWAMQFRGLDEKRGLVLCRPENGDLPKYGHVHCHTQWGHSGFPLYPMVDLGTALRRSCNVYFAMLGDQYYDGESMRAMLSAFGFGQPTGIRSLPRAEEPNVLFEDWAFQGPLARPQDPLYEVQRQRLANGLSYISVTPMQIARAYVGLATGILPEVRLLRGLEGLQKPRARQVLPISEGVRAFLRKTLVSVVERDDGSAYHKGLDHKSLGYQVALKTGSADYRKGSVPRGGPQGTVWESGMRKHAWVAGWFPADQPQVIFTVYVHDTAATSSHGAVYLAAQLLQREEVKAYLREQGVALEQR